MLLERIASHSQACCASRPVPAVLETAGHRASKRASICTIGAGSRINRTAPRAHQDDREVIQGYTPANYISYAPGLEHRCHHMVAIDVEAPASVCYDLWSNWARLVDFLDLISQVGMQRTQTKRRQWHDRHAKRFSGGTQATHAQLSPPHLEC